MKSIVFFVMFLISSNFALSQLLNIPRLGNEVMRENKYVDYEGSPYLYPSWKPGIITDKTGKTYDNQQLKYNSYKDQVEINQEGNQIVLNSSLYYKFVFILIDENSNKTMHRVFQSGYKIDNYTEKDYFEVLYDGSVKFLKKVKTEFMEENVNSYGSGGQIKRFLTKERYFIINRAGVASELRINKKSLIEAMGDDKESVARYIENNKVKVKSEIDILFILRQLN